MQKDKFFTVRSSKSSIIQKGKGASILPLFLSFVMLWMAFPVKAQANVSLPESVTQINISNISIAPGASTSTIQEAIDHVNSSGGGKVIFQSGTYILTGSVTLKSNVSLVGAGRDNTILKLSAGINLGGYGVLNRPDGGLSNVTIKNLTIDANTFTDPDSNPTALRNYGILVQGENGTNNRIMLNNIKVTNSEMGVHFKGTTNLTIQDSIINNNGGLNKYWHNLYLRRVSNVLVKNTELSESSSGNGINISYSDNITIDSCQVYDNAFRGIRASDSSHINVINNDVYGNVTGDGIVYIDEITGVTSFQIKGNTVRNNGGYGIFVSSDSSNGEVKSNIDGGGNTKGFSLISGSNIIIQ